MSIELKIKSKTLAAEARIIRIEKNRARAQHKTELVNTLDAHRRGVVRKAARSTHLARAFLKGTPYKKVERTHSRTYKKGPNWAAVEQMVRKYGVGDMRDRMQRFSEWIEYEWIPDSVAA